MPEDPSDPRSRRRPSAIRLGQLLLVVAALALWIAARLPWVIIESSDGLGQPKTTTISGGTWSTALLPLALLLLAAAVAGLAVRGWRLRLLAVLVAASSAAAAYLAISQWVVPDIAVRAADLAGVQVMFLVGSERRYGGAAVTLAAAVCALVAAVLLMRSAAVAKTASTKYDAPAARRSAVRADIAHPDVESDGTAAAVSERVLWDALDDGHDPTAESQGGQEGPDSASDNQGR